MTTTITWKIANLERETADGFVFTAAYGSIGLERPESLVPFADLTEEIVVGWVKEKLGEEAVTNVETALQAQIDEQHAPTKATGLPWAA